jgi:TolB-like protein/DNA-binding winged helix-turn-helix (wHTH) protein
MDFLVSDQGEYCFGPFRLGPNRRLLLRDGVPLKIQPRLFDTLLYLIRHAGRVVEKDELIAAVWPGRVIEDHNLTQSISALRRVLQSDGSAETYIVTIPNRGYRFVAPVHLERAEPENLLPLPALAATPKAAPAGRRPIMTLASLALAAAVLGAGAWLMIRAPHDLAAPTAEAPFQPPPHSVAVLAFSNMSGDAGQEYFSDGISEELIDTLGRLDGLRVAARVSAFTFKGSKATVAEIGRKLNVGAVLEGSVRRDGESLRITAELIDTRTGYQLWSQRYDRPNGSVLQVQDDIAERVTQALRLKLLGDASAQLTLGGTANAEAFDAYLHGRSLADSTGPSHDTLANDEAALQDYDKALALDPNYALAEAARAVTVCNMSGSGRPSPTQRQRLENDAINAARHAVAIAPDLGMAYAQLAYVLQVCSFDFVDAGTALSRAVALAPGDADVLREASALATHTHPDRALPIVQRLVTLDPLNPRSYDGLARTFYYARRYDDAVAALRHAASLRGSPSVLEDDLRGMIALMRGDPATTVAVCGRALNWQENVALAIAYYQLHRPQDAATSAARVHAVLGEAGAYQYAEIAAQWGSKDEALSWLETAYQLRDHGLTRINTDPWLDPVRDAPRFREIVQKLNLPP